MPTSPDNATPKPTEIVLAIDGRSGSPNLELAWAELARTVFRIFKEKQHDYGPNNIALFQDKGVLTRITDKFMRLHTLYAFKDKTNTYMQDAPAINEPIDDTWLDIADYAIIALMCRAGSWPKIALSDVKLFKDPLQRAQEALNAQMRTCVCGGTGLVHQPMSPDQTMTTECNECLNLRVIQRSLRAALSHLQDNKEPENVKHECQDRSPNLPTPER